jgi:hypothetical protein
MVLRGGGSYCLMGKGFNLGRRKILKISDGCTTINATEHDY